MDDGKELYLVSEQAQVLRTNLSEITTTIGRKTKGVTIFRLDKGDSVASIACVGDLDSNGASATGSGKDKAATAKKSENSVAEAEPGQKSDNHQLSLEDIAEDGGDN